MSERRTQEAVVKQVIHFGPEGDPNRLSLVECYGDIPGDQEGHFGIELSRWPGGEEAANRMIGKRVRITSEVELVGDVVQSVKVIVEELSAGSQESTGR